MVETMIIGYIPSNDGKLLENKYVNVSCEEKAVHEKLNSLIDIKKALIP